MSWLRLEGRMPQHHKVAPLSDAAFRLHVTAMAWCIEGKTDGKVPLAIPQTFTRAPSGKKLAAVLKELTDFGVWIAKSDGYQIHDFLQWNLSAAEIKARAESKAKAGAAGGKRSGEARGKQEASTGEAAASGLLDEAARNGEPKPKPLPKSLSQSLPERKEEEIVELKLDAPDPLVPEAPQDGTAASCREVFEFWRLELNHPHAKFDDKRRARIKGHLNRGFTVRELCLAIRGAKLDPWLMGTDPKSTTSYTDICQVLRDTAQVERLKTKALDAIAGGPSGNGDAERRAKAKAAEQRAQLELQVRRQEARRALETDSPSGVFATAADASLSAPGVSTVAS